MTENKDTLVIIDADGLIYSSAYKVNSADEALAKCKEYLYNIYYHTKATHSIGFLTNSSHRYKIATTKDYKGNRKDFVKPKYFNLLLEYLKDNYNFGGLPNTEADDLCISAYMKYKTEFNCIISSPDKDLKQIEGQFYNPRTFKKEFITREQAEYNFYSQMLTGDTTDNIVGIPGVGEKTAIKILNGVETNNLFEKVLEAYTSYYKIPSLATYYFSENYLLLFLRSNLEFDVPVNCLNVDEIREYVKNLNNDKEERKGIKAGEFGIEEGEDEKKTPIF